MAKRGRSQKIIKPESKETPRFFDKDTVKKIGIWFLCVGVLLCAVTIYVSQKKKPVTKSVSPEAAYTSIMPSQVTLMPSPGVTTTAKIRGLANTSSR